LVLIQLSGGRREYRAAVILSELARTVLAALSRAVIGFERFPAQI
jgi:hypothetical protein